MRLTDEMARILDSLDHIDITGLSAFGIHGVYAEEKRREQQFVIDVRLSLDPRDGNATDNLAHGPDYTQVAAAVRGAVAAWSFNLIETLADRLADQLTTFPAVVAARVTVHKPRAARDTEAVDVSVTVTRARS